MHNQRDVFAGQRRDVLPFGPASVLLSVNEMAD